MKNQYLTSIFERFEISETLDININENQYLTTVFERFEISETLKMFSFIPYLKYVKYL